MGSVFFDKSSKAIENVLKFILIQDPMKIAIGTAMGLTVKTLFTQVTDDLVKPIVKIILHSISNSGLNFTVFGQTVGIGNVVEQFIIFLLFMVVVFYGFIQPINKLREKYDIDQKTTACPYCTTLINPNATRCPACTSQLKT